MPKANKPLIGIILDNQPAGKYSALSPWYALREEYIRAIDAAGGIPLLLPHVEGAISDYLNLIIPLLLPHVEGAISDYLNLIHGLIIPGGDFDIDPARYGAKTVHPTVTLNPQRTSFEWGMLSQALTTQMPVLGICGGMQLLNVVRGGTLVQDIEAEVANCLAHKRQANGVLESHAIHIKEGSRLATLFGAGPTEINSAHHQAIAKLGHGLIAAAHTDDGLIEAIEDPDHDFCMGVQWHPEYIDHPQEMALMKQFVTHADLFRGTTK